MRSAGFGVRVVADECGSREENPPLPPESSLVPGQSAIPPSHRSGSFFPIGRFQLGNPIAMYLSTPLPVLMTDAIDLGDLRSDGSLAFRVSSHHPPAPEGGSC
jgi:hypothetical protein